MPDACPACHMRESSRGGTSQLSTSDVADDDPVVEFLVRFVLLDQLRSRHLDDGTGHCTTCSAGGQVGRDVWPCRLAGYVARASGRGRQTVSGRSLVAATV